MCKIVVILYSITTSLSDVLGFVKNKKTAPNSKELGADFMPYSFYIKLIN